MRIEENIEGDLKLTTNLVNSGDSYFIEHLLCARCCSRHWGYCMNETKPLSSWSLYSRRGDTWQSRRRGLGLSGQEEGMQARRASGEACCRQKEQKCGRSLLVCSRPVRLEQTSRGTARQGHGGTSDCRRAKQKSNRGS